MIPAVDQVVLWATEAGLNQELAREVATKVMVTPVDWVEQVRDAVAAGIGMVHQHFMLVPVFTVAESVALGYEPVGPMGIIDARAAAARVREISERFGFDVDPAARIEDVNPDTDPEQLRAQVDYLIGEQVHDLALALVTPLGADHHQIPAHESFPVSRH